MPHILQNVLSFSLQNMLSLATASGKLKRCKHDKPLGWVGKAVSNMQDPSSYEPLTSSLQSVLVHFVINYFFAVNLLMVEVPTFDTNPAPVIFGQCDLKANTGIAVYVIGSALILLFFPTIILVVAYLLSFGLGSIGFESIQRWVGKQARAASAAFRLSSTYKYLHRRTPSRAPQPEAVQRNT